jgi:sulfur relay (sulfurtransferase) complex TusBCD TusD component (DsrE family)
MDQMDRGRVRMGDAYQQAEVHTCAFCHKQRSVTRETIGQKKSRKALVAGGHRQSEASYG